MKLIVPFDTSINPPERHWTALWKPDVEPEAPSATNNILRRNIPSVDPGALLNPEDQIQVGKSEGSSTLAHTKHALGAIGEWFAHREEREAEEQEAASQGLDDLHRQMRARDAVRSRQSRI